MDDQQARTGMRELAPHECLDLLTSNEVGRLAFLVDGDPDVVPVNYVVDGGTLVFRTGRGSRVAERVAGRLVAFQIDGMVAATRSGWSVVVRGEATLLEEPTDVERIRRLPLLTWAPGERDCFIRITPSVMTGRQVRPGAEVSTLWLG